MRTRTLLVALAVACDPGKSTNVSEGALEGRGGDDDDGSIGVDGSDGSDGADGGDGGGAALLDLTLDRPASYGQGTVVVTGTVSPVAAVDRVSVAGAPAAVDAAGAWSAEVPLAGAPFALAEVTATGTDGAALSLTGQVGAAAPSSAAAPAGQQTTLGRPGGDALADLLGGFAQEADFRPAAGLLLAQEVCEPCPAALECPDISETLRTTGAATLSVTAALDPSTGRLDLDVAGSTLSWGVEVIHAGYIDAETTGTLDLSLGAVSASGDPLSCAGLGLDVALSAPARSWALSETTYCVDADTLGEASGLWADRGRPGLEAAACRWAPWLDDALASEVEAMALTPAATADAAGVVVDWAAAPADAAMPPWWAPDRPSPLSPDGIDVALRDRLLGAALDVALRARLPAQASADLPEGEATLSLTGLHPDVATLAAVTAAGGSALLAPVAYTLELDGVACEAAHLVPDAVALEVTAEDGGWVVSVDGPTAAGADALPGCDLDPGDRAALLDAALAEVAGELSIRWRTGAGLLEAGASASPGAAAAAYTVSLSL